MLGGPKKAGVRDARQKCSLRHSRRKPRKCFGRSDLNLAESRKCGREGSKHGRARSWSLFGPRNSWGLSTLPKAKVGLSRNRGPPKNSWFLFGGPFQPPQIVRDHKRTDTPQTLATGFSSVKKSRFRPRVNRPRLAPLQIQFAFGASRDSRQVWILSLGVFL